MAWPVYWQREPMATNLIQLSDQLKHVSDTQLQQELQQPSGAVPPYLVLAEAQRRSLMRSGSQTQGQQSTVLDDTLRSLNAHQMPPAGPGMPPPPAGAPPGMPPVSFQGQPPSGLGAAAPPPGTPPQNFQPPPPQPMQEGGLVDDSNDQDYLAELGRRQQWASGMLLPGYREGGIYGPAETAQDAPTASYLRRQFGGATEESDGDDSGDDGEDSDEDSAEREPEDNGEEDSGSGGVGDDGEDEQEDDVTDLRPFGLGAATASPAAAAAPSASTTEAAAAPQPNLISRLTKAIARFEGFYPGTVAHRNNNPGNLRWAANQADSRGGFAVFHDAAAGFRALEQHVSKLVDEGLTLNQFFAGKKGVYPGYAPAADHNSPYHYASTVGTWLGVPTNVPLDQLSGKGMQKGGEFEEDEDGRDYNPYAAELGSADDGGDGDPFAARFDDGGDDDGGDGGGADDGGADGDSDENDQTPQIPETEEEADREAPQEVTPQGAEARGEADREAPESPGWREATPEEIAESARAQVAPEQPLPPQGDWMGITSPQTSSETVAPPAPADTTQPTGLATASGPDDMAWWQQFQKQNQLNQSRLETLYGKLQQRPPIGDLLLRMGAGMMAGTSPHAMTNIGQGLLGGVNAMDQQKQQQLANTLRVLQEEGTLSGQQATLAVHEADRRAALARQVATQQATDARAVLNGKRRVWAELIKLPGAEGAANAPPDGKPVAVSGYAFHEDPDNPGQGKWISKTQTVPIKLAAADIPYAYQAGIDPTKPETFNAANMATLTELKQAGRQQNLNAFQRYAEKYLGKPWAQINADEQDEAEQRYAKERHFTDPQAQELRQQVHDDTQTYRGQQQLMTGYHQNRQEIVKLQDGVNKQMEPLLALQEMLRNVNPTTASLIPIDAIRTIVGGAGSNVRVNIPEINQYIHGRSNWDEMKALLQGWKSGVKLTDQQLDATRALADYTLSKLQARQQLLEWHSTRLLGAKSTAEQNQEAARAQEDVNKINRGYVPVQLSNGDWRLAANPEEANKLIGSQVDPDAVLKNIKP
ncbi:MAG TPA: hypothetical protein VH157_07090 [Bryobacteraceae bacterium]|jgi:hypothetical protein|nr:hypothetical protein [Bryobacteraceae bacterium]